MRWLLLLSWAVMVVGCSGPKATAEGAPGKAASGSSSLDAEWERQAAAGQEAREWLARPNTAVASGSKEEATQRVEALYAAGSPRITMVDAHAMPEAGGKEIGSVFAIQLPAQGRTAVFDAYNKLFADDPRKDEGQKFLTMSD